MDALLSIVERVSRLSPVNDVVNKIVDRIAPKAIAQACWGNCVLGSYCSNNQRIVVYGVQIQPYPGYYVCVSPACSVPSGAC